MLTKLNYAELDEFCKKIRRVAFESTLKVSAKKKKKKFIPPLEEDINAVISIREIRTLLIAEYSVDTTNEHVVLNNDYAVCQKMLESIVNRLINNELNKMVNEGVLDCYFDDVANEFLFKVIKET